MAPMQMMMAMILSTLKRGGELTLLTDLKACFEAERVLRGVLASFGGLGGRERARRAEWVDEPARAEEADRADGAELADEAERAERAERADGAERADEAELACEAERADGVERVEGVERPWLLSVR